MRHPFDEERLVGFVYRVEPTAVEVTLPHAGRRPKTFHGLRLARGEVGEFVVVDVGGQGLFGRVSVVWLAARDRDAAEFVSTRESEIHPVGRVQLFSTIRMDGTHARGLDRYPRIGDPVYSAAPDVLEAVLGQAPVDSKEDDRQVLMGTLASATAVVVKISPERLIGRHLAVVGATGSGKSWTVAHIIEEVHRLGGKAIVIDATGEFRTLDAIATHIAIGGPATPTDGATATSLPHTEMTESDLHVFLRPSAGAQLPRLRAAVQSLRLAAVLEPDDPLVEGGCIRKAHLPRKPYLAAYKEHITVVEAPTGAFDLNLLPVQIQHECVYDVDLNDHTKFGSRLMNDIAYCTSLIARTYDVLRSPETMAVLQPTDARASAFEALESFLVDSSSHVLRISLRELPFARSLREIVVNAIGRRLLELAREGRFATKPLLVCIDEAHQFFGRTVGDEFVSTRLEHFESIAKEGRKYGLTVCMATQRPGDIPGAVLSQAGMLLVHRLGDGRDRERIEQASSELDRSAAEQLPSLLPGEALFVGVDFPVPIAVRIKRPMRPPASEGPSYSSGWGTAPRET